MLGNNRQCVSNPDITPCYQIPHEAYLPFEIVCLIRGVSDTLSAGRTYQHSVLMVQLLQCALYSSHTLLPLLCQRLIEYTLIIISGGSIRVTMGYNKVLMSN